MNQLLTALLDSFNPKETVTVRVTASPVRWPVSELARRVQVSALLLRDAHCHCC